MWRSLSLYTSGMFELAQCMFHRRYGHSSLFVWVCGVHLNRWGILFRERSGVGQQTRSHSHQIHGEEFCVCVGSQIHDWFYWCFGGLPDCLRVEMDHPTNKGKCNSLCEIPNAKTIAFDTIICLFGAGWSVSFNFLFLCT